MTTTNPHPANPQPTSVSTSDTAQSPIERLQFGVLVTIVLVVGGMAGAASFSHVHDWTITNSPQGTGDWFGWANAVISELIPTAALIVIARRRKNGQPIGYPMFLLVVAVGLSLTAQLAVAVPTVFGWLVSAIPALAFFALSKLVFTATRPAPAPAPAALAPAPSVSDPAPATARPTARTSAAKSTPRKPRAPRIPANKTTTPAKAPTPPAETIEPVTLPVVPVAELPAAPVVPATRVEDWLPIAARIATEHQRHEGEPITAGQLAVRLRIPTPTATDLLAALNTTPAVTTTAPHNGIPVTIDGITR